MSRTARILLVSPDEALIRRIEESVPVGDIQLIKAPLGQPASRLVQEYDPDVVIAPCSLIEGQPEVFHRSLLDSTGDPIPLIVVAEMGPFERVAKCIRDGTDWFIHQPFESKELILLIRSVLETRRLRRDVQTLQDRLALQYPFGTIVAHSRAMREVIRLARRVAPKPTTVLLLGASGTGKELLARTIHHHSSRQQGPFAAVNCSSLPETLLASELFGHVRGAFTGAYSHKRGLLEAASGGTLFLDEIGEAPHRLQTDLLRAVQEQVVRPIGSHEDRHVDVRLIAATNRDLAQDVRDGRFREDLYFRLNVFPIRLPDLRDRKEDIPPLAQHFILKYSKRLNSPVRHISQEAMDCLLDYDWPGNVRELESAIQHAMVLATGCTILRRHLPRSLRELPKEQPKDLQSIPSLQQAEYELILRTLEHTHFNKAEAARLLGMNRSSLHRKIRRYGISIPKGRTKESVGEPP